MGNNITAVDFGKVAVLMGGSSSEREISLLSGNEVLAACLECGINAYSIDVDDNIENQLIADKPDRVFIALHGGDGENGEIQNLLDKLKIPYIGSGMQASALAMDKAACNLFLRNFELPVLPSMILHQEDSLGEIAAKFNLPLCVKPTTSGSSCGVTKVAKLEQLPQAYYDAKEYGSVIMVEPWIEGREFTVGILGDQALPVVEITTPEGFYDYQAKYFKDDTGYICPCDLTAEQQQQMQQIALKIFSHTGCRHWARVDFMQDGDGKFWFLEINTIPGLTTHSLVPKAAREIGIEFKQLIWQILAFTLE